MKNKQYKNIVILVALCSCWNIAAWQIAKQYYVVRIQRIVKEETRLSQERASDLADSIHRNLNYISGVSDLLSQLTSVTQTTSRFGANVSRSALPLELRKAEWTNDASLNELSRYLLLAQTRLHADLIYVVNAAGDCIAASNFGTAGSPIGSNYGERKIFRLNRSGRKGMQYAVGKTTHIPGLFFGSPVVIAGRFMGAVVTKVDVPHLSFLVGQVNALVTDDKGVIILAHDKRLEMNAMPGAAAPTMPEKSIFDRYRLKNIPALALKPWGNDEFASLFRLQHSDTPYVLIPRDIPEYGMKVYVNSEITDFGSITQEHYWFFFLLGMSGSVLILMAYGAALYLGSIRKSRAQLWTQANFDTLTGLANRSLFYDRLDHEVRASRRTGHAIGLLLIDIDQFKEVNDSLGHAGGDILLNEAARRIQASVRESDTVARLGGDEFTVIFSNLSDKCHLEDVAQKIIRELAKPFQIGNEVAHVSASIGITLYPDDATETGLLIKNADQAMYVAKKGGRNRFSYYTQALQEAAQKRLRLAKDMRGALETNQFCIYFQPIVELSSDHIHKAEALLRWQHPERGFISPAEFIPLAEETGAIHEIGNWVFKESARWAKRWTSQFSEDFQVSVNKSPVQFRAEGNAHTGDWLRFLQDLGLPGKNMAIEITEGLLLNVESESIDKLFVFRDAGIQVAVDDFGTGYSSLSYLKKFDIDYLKIDRLFVSNLETEPESLALCEAIIVMAHKLGLKVIAEGVETEMQRNMLVTAGCDYAQGYWFSKPVTPADFEALLSSRYRIAPSGVSSGHASAPASPSYA